MQRLDDLLLFVAVVDHGGFAAAARQLGMQRSKLSRRLAELEGRLGLRLLQRNTRQVTLTPGGAEIYTHATRMAEQAQAAFDAAAELRGEPRGILRLTCPASFAAVMLVPVLAEFIQAYPRVEVIVDGSDRSVDLVGEGYDLAFRGHTVPLENSNLVARVVGEVSMCLVISPALLAQGVPESPAQLPAFGLLARGDREGKMHLRLWQKGQEPLELEYRPRLISGSFQILLAAALAGMGVAFLPRYLCQVALEEGRLHEVLTAAAGWCLEPGQMHAIVPARRGLPLATRLFLEFALPRLSQRLLASAATPAVKFGVAGSNESQHV